MTPEPTKRLTDEAEVNRLLLVAATEQLGWWRTTALVALAVLGLQLVAKATGCVL